MSVLERWTPFKFRRNKESRAVAQTSEASGQRSELTPMQRMMENFLGDSFLSSFGNMPSLLSSDSWFGDFSASRFQPKIDVTDADKSIRVTAEMPGVQKDDIHLSFDRGAITIRGEKKNEFEKDEKGVYRTERSYGYFERTLPMPKDLAFDKAEANFSDGLLTIVIPKSNEKPQEQKISIS